MITFAIICYASILASPIALCVAHATGRRRR